MPQPVTLKKLKLNDSMKTYTHPQRPRTDWAAVVHSDPCGRSNHPVTELDNSEGVYDGLGADPRRPLCSGLHPQ